MGNIKIKIDFPDGKVLDFTVEDDISELVMKGADLQIRTSHPRFSFKAICKFIIPSEDRN